MMGSAFKGATSSGKTSSNKVEMDLQNTIFKGLDSVKFGEDYSGRPTGSFANAGEKAAVERVVNLFGSPEEQQQAAELGAEELYGLAKNIRTRRDAEILGVGKTTTTPSAKSLFSSKKAPPMATPP
jgi:hypothetical protein